MVAITKWCEFVMTSGARHLLLARSGKVAQGRAKSRSLASLRYARDDKSKTPLVMTNREQLF